MQAAEDSGAMWHFPQVKLSIQGAIATVWLDLPDRLNAISPTMVGGLNAALDRVSEQKAQIRCVVLTGAGRAFCAGGNQDHRRDPGELARGAGADMETVYHPFIRRLRDLHCPLVTSVNGPAAGGGMAIALMGDLVIASETAFFLQAFRHIGLVPDCGSSWLLPRLVGKARAMELSMLGERLPARKALEWGLVNFVVPAGELAAETMRLAGALAEGPPVALNMTRKLYWDSPHNTFEEQLAAEARAQRAAGATRDFAEGVSAYLEKRPPRFSGS